MAKLSDRKLAGLTREFKKRLNGGESLDDILPEAFAAICEADRRVLGMFPFDVQVLGAIALHQGYMAEMNTGEGKTLAATMPLYLNALSGKSAILVTTNEYLALRDAREMGRVYEFMGLSVAAGVPEKSGDNFKNDEKKKIYESDIVYTTHGVLGFDYLLNNLVSTASDRFLREFCYVIIDEADSVLLDGAQTPLVIAGSPRVQSNLYEMADFFVTTLTEGRDYEKEDNAVWLTEEGIAYAERFFQIDNFYGDAYFEINRHVILALRAHKLFERQKEYIVSDSNELCLLDSGSGRLMSGVKLRGGQHQALEAKEKLEISQENRSVASITFQNFFLLFPKLAGMSGTISDAEEELLAVYHTRVVVIPPNRPLRRVDLDDFYFRDAKKQFAAAIGMVRLLHAKGQPVLVVASSIEETELVSERLLRARVSHNVLNANNAAWEAEIIKEAGQKKAVTVATSMAGRGTDIKLGKGVQELGGLAVIGIGRMANVRLERQARGRAGRQGDPGISRFFVSLEDQVVRNTGSAKLEKYIDGSRRIGKRRLRRVINGAQRTGEESAVMARRQAMNYDQVLRFQRKLIYEVRDRLLDGQGMDEGKLMEIARQNIAELLASGEITDTGALRRYVLDHISYRLDRKMPAFSLEDTDAVEKYLLYRVQQSLRQQRNRLGSRKRLNDFMRVAALQAIDDGWVEQVDYLQQMQAAVSGRTAAQRNPIYEFQKDALESFRKMERSILNHVMRNILLSSVEIDEQDNLHILLP
jgi:preprotein translocase subunit SecA